MIGGWISRSGRGAATELGRVVGPHTYGLWRSLVSALVWGTRGREFESPQPDYPRKGFRGFGNPPRVTAPRCSPADISTASVTATAWSRTHAASQAGTIRYWRSTITSSSSLGWMADD